MGWWLPVLLLLYTLAGKPPLTSAVIFQKVACKFAFYAIALMQHVTSCNLSPIVGGPVSRVIAQEQKGWVGEWRGASREIVGGERGLVPLDLRWKKNERLMMLMMCRGDVKQKVRGRVHLTGWGGG